MKYVILCVFLCFLCYGEEKLPMSLQAAWDYVQEHNDGIKAQELGIQRSQKLKTAARSLYLPKVDILGLYTRLSDPVILDVASNIPSSPMLPIPPPALKQMFPPTTLIDENVMLGVVRVVLPLYTGGARGYLNNIADIQLQDAKELLRLKKLATFEELVRVYYGVLFAQELSLLLQEQEESALKHYQNALKLKKAGQIAQLEVLGAQVAYDKAKNDARVAQSDTEIAQLALNTIMQNHIIIPRGSLKVHLGLQDLEFYIQQTINAYPALRNIHNKTLEAKEFVNIQWASFMPQIALEGMYVKTDESSLLEQHFSPWSLMAVVRVPIISPEGRLPKYQAAKIAELQLNKLESQAISEMRLLVEKTYKEAKSAEEKYFSLQSSIMLAQEHLKLQEKAFAQGIATQVQVNDARNMFLASMVEQKGVAYKYMMLVAKLMVLSSDIEGFYSFI